MTLRFVRKANGRPSSVSLSGVDNAWSATVAHERFPGHAFDLKYGKANLRQELFGLFNGFGHKVWFSAAREV